MHLLWATFHFFRTTPDTVVIHSLPIAQIKDSLIEQELKNLAQKSSELWLFGIPPIIWTIIAPTISALVIFTISAIYAKKKDSWQKRQERNEYESYLYEYLKIAIEKTRAVATALFETTSALRVERIANVPMKNIDNKLLTLFFDLPQNKIYESYFLNKKGSAEEKAKAYTAIMKGMSTICGAIKVKEDNQQRFFEQFSQLQEKLNLELGRYEQFDDRRHSILATSKEDANLFIEIDKIIASYQSDADMKQKENKDFRADIFHYAKMYEDLEITSKKYPTLEIAAYLMRLCQAILRELNNLNNFRELHAVTFENLAIQLVASATEIETNYEILRKMKSI